MTTLITGTTGFVGSHLLAAIEDAQAFPADLTQPLPELPAAECVIHCAGVMDDVSRMRAVNVEGTARLVEAAVAGVQRFLFLSTGGVTGDGPYAQTKAEAEAIVLRAREKMEVHVLRLFFPYGPGQRPQRLMPRLIANVREGKNVMIEGDGGPRLSLTFIDDVVEAIVRMRDVAGSHVVDVGAPAVALRDVAWKIGDLVQRNVQFVTREEPAHDWIADPEPLRALTGFAPSIPIDEGLRACV